MNTQIFNLIKYDLNGLLSLRAKLSNKHRYRNSLMEQK